MKALRVSSLLFASCVLLAGCGPSALQTVENHRNAIIANLGPDVNSTHDDYACALDVNRLYITSNRPTVEGYIQGDDIWFSDISRGSWSRALNLGGVINSQSDEGAPFLTQDGGTIYFVECWTEDGLGDGDIYTANIDAGGKWQRLTNVGNTVNSKYWESHPYVSPDGSELYFASDRPGGQGGTDIWVSKRLRSGKWGPPANLGRVVNTSGDEKAPCIGPNGADLYFASNGLPGLGGYDLYRTRNEGKKGWTEPVNIGRPFNTNADEMFFRLSAREDSVFLSSNREGGMGGLDLYVVAPNPFKDTTRYQFFVAGSVVDSLTGQGIQNARLAVKSERGRIDTLLTGRGGSYRFSTEQGAAWTLTAMAPEYNPKTVKVSVPNPLASREYRRTIALLPVPKVVKAPDREDLPSAVYFEFDKADLPPEFVSVLDALFASAIKPLLDANRDVEIVLDAHTDDFGTEPYNINLSRRRGAAVSKYLQSKGAPLSSIVVNAYGEAKPAAGNDDDEGRKKNRRVEVRINALTQK